MRTVGSHWPTSAPRNDRLAVCDICGTVLRRSQMTVNGDNLTVCRRIHGPSAAELTERNIARSPQPEAENDPGGPVVRWERAETYPVGTIDCPYRDLGVAKTMHSEGTNPPVLTITGSQPYLNLRIECTIAGPIGTWRYRMSWDGGQTWLANILSGPVNPFLPWTLYIAAGTASLDNVWTWFDWMKATF